MGWKFWKTDKPAETILIEKEPGPEDLVLVPKGTETRLRMRAMRLEQIIERHGDDTEVMLPYVRELNIINAKLA